MANPTTPIQSCVLRVGIKCCRGCQTKAKKKLLSVSGVKAVEYNAEQGVVTVSGDDVNPTTLLDKQSSKKRVEKKRTKCFLLRCFRKQSGKAKVEPYRGEAATPLINRGGHPTPRVYPPPQPMYAFQAPILPYPPPFFGPPPPLYATAPAAMHSPPYYHTVNSRLL